MDILDPLINFAQNSNPFLLILTGIVLIAVLYLLFRLAANLVLRVLSCGCALVVLAGVVWVVITFIL